MRTLAEFGTKCDVALEKYIPENSIIGIDVSALLCGNPQMLIRNLVKISETGKARLVIDEDFEQELSAVLDECCGSILTQKQRKSGEEAWKQLSAVLDERCGSMLTQKQRKSSEEEGQENPREAIWVTGNATEAQRAILTGLAGSILLVTGEGSFWLDAQNYGKWIPDMEKVSVSRASGEMVPEHPKFLSGKGKTLNCEVSRLDRKNNHRFYQVKDAGLLIKYAQEPEKLDWMIRHRPQVDCFAWPEEKIYYKKESRRFRFVTERGLFGYSMKERSPKHKLTDIFSLRRDYIARLELALRMIKNALLLHAQGILISDYNFENFGLDDEGNLLMMDCMEYSVHDLVGRYEAPPSQKLKEEMDYSRKSGYIAAEYQYLKAMTACILCNGKWPYDDRAMDGTDLRMQDGRADAEKVLQMETPQQMLLELWKIYEQKQQHEVKCSHLVNLKSLDFQPLPGIRRRTILLMVENSCKSQPYVREMARCVKELLETMRQDYGLTAHSTDILVVNFSDTVKNTGLGTDWKGFVPLSDLFGAPSFVKDYYLGSETREAQYGTALQSLDEILMERKRNTDTWIPFGILLGTFQGGISDGTFGTRPESFRKVNGNIEAEQYRLVNVKFGAEEGPLFNELGEERLLYEGPDCVRNILDCLIDKSSVITPFQ